MISEWGVFENILERIVGDIPDEYDHAANEPCIERRDDGTYVVDRGGPVRETNDRLNLTFDTDDVDTIGG